MELIGDSRQQEERFKELAYQATKIDIAVAWVGPCDAVEVLKNCNAKIRMAVGISGNNTYPDTLEELAALETVELRIYPDEPREIFHPKYYCFYGPKNVCWVGSPNLTLGGFRRNVELVSESVIDSEKDTKYWFESIWNKLDTNPSHHIKKYRESWEKPKFPPSPRRIPQHEELPALTEIHTWDNFVDALRTYDEHCRSEQYFSVLGDTHSWLHTALVGNKVVRIEDWTTLTERQCYVLRGLTTKNETEGVWGLFGRLKQARQASYILNNERKPSVNVCRRIIRQELEPIFGCPFVDLPNVAQRAVYGISRVHRRGVSYTVGAAAASRWLTLARPDGLVSVNSRSKTMFSTATQLPQHSLHAKYDRLIRWIHEQAWFNEYNKKEPKTRLEKDIWDCRAALVDVFSYSSWKKD
ncbi:MAG: hypothetical protein F4039_02265 [Gammaproteobacteria bacterium]|nr:hypothetical protein [Gammaproteobacteria bacterium]MYF53864.1 hypothetical protein [Gammaproteobacteria bacterium]MYK42899.1 hypothetical protein [Gammaproteobacteria bacterium]